jgi:hypothetical protein
LTAPLFRVASTASGGAYTEITDSGTISATSDLTLYCPGNILSLGDVDDEVEGVKLVLDNSFGNCVLDGGVELSLIGTSVTVSGPLTGSTATFSGLLTASAGISASGATFSGNVAMTSTSSHTGLASFAGGLSAAGGVTFNTSIQTTRLPRLSSSVFEAKTANWTPTNADDGKIFTVSIGGKSTITCTLNGLSPGVHFKILVITGNVTFSVTGTGSGSAISLGLSAPSSTTVYCRATDTYFATDSA